MKHSKFLPPVLICFILLCFGSAALAASTASTPLAEQSLLQVNKFVIKKLAPAPPFLIISTTDTAGSVQQALTDHGITFDLFSGADWSGIDLSGYNTVIIGMDGGSVSAASVQNVANFVTNGGRLIIIGGSALAEWTNAVNTYLLANATANYDWAISAQPHLTITDPAHILATGLPGTYNFTNPSAAFYQIKSTDPAASVAAVNGDGYAAIFSKTIGSGTLIWFINSAEEGYWSNPADYNILSTFIANAIDYGEAPPAPSSIPSLNEWGMMILVAFLGISTLYFLKRQKKSEC